MITCALYARVSTDDQAEHGYGLAAQLADMRRRAAAAGYHVPPGGEFVDDGYSGATLDRPALTRLREAVRAGSFDLVLIHDPDRLARKLSFQLLLLDEFEARVRVEFVLTDNADTPDGRLLRNVRGVIGEFEREKMRVRMAGGRRERLKTGRVVLSVAPIGYRLAGDKGARLDVHEPEAATVRMMFAWLVREQRSLRSIARELQQLGVPTRHGAKWRVSTVRKIIANALYTGTATFHAAGETLTVPVPEIIAPGLWEAAQAQLRRNVETINGRPPAQMYLLRGLVRCGRCGRRMAGERRYYACTNRDAVVGDGCTSLAHRVRLETMVWRTVAAIIRDPERLRSGLDARLQRLGASQVSARSTADDLQRRLTDLDTKEERLLSLWLDAELADDAKGSVKTRLSEIAGQRRTLRERLTTARSRAAEANAEHARHEAVRRYCAAISRGLDRLPDEGRRKVLMACVDAIVINGKTVEIQGILPGRTDVGRTVHTDTLAWTVTGVVV